jgi:hypothetical protein
MFGAFSNWSHMISIILRSPSLSAVSKSTTLLVEMLQFGYISKYLNFFWLFSSLRNWEMVKFVSTILLWEIGENRFAEN